MTKRWLLCWGVVFLLKTLPCQAQDYAPDILFERKLDTDPIPAELRDLAAKGLVGSIDKKTMDSSPQVSAGKTNWQCITPKIVVAGVTSVGGMAAAYKGKYFQSISAGIVATAEIYEAYSCPDISSKSPSGTSPKDNSHEPGTNGGDDRRGPQGGNSSPPAEPPDGTDIIDLSPKGSPTEKGGNKDSGKDQGKDKDKGKDQGKGNDKGKGSESKGGSDKGSTKDPMNNV